MADDLHFLQLTELAAYIKAGEISPLEATRAQLDRIAALDGTLGSYVHVMADAAMAQAETAQAEIMAGRYRGPLHGIPIALKDCSGRRAFRRLPVPPFTGITGRRTTQAWYAG